MKGRIVLPVESPFGTKEYSHWPASAAGLEPVKGSNFMDKLKSGTIQTSHIGLALMVVIFASSEIAMINSYESNPRHFEETLEQTMSWAMPASIGSFFVGGWATDKSASLAADGLRRLNVAKRAKANLVSYVENKKMFVNDPELGSKFVKGNMQTIKASSFLERATTYKGLTGGFLISQFVYRYVNRLESCRKVLGGLESGEYTAFERNRLRQACDQTVGQMIKEIAESPDTWMQLTALLSTKALLTFGMNTAQILKYGVASSPTSARALQGASKFVPYQVKIVSRGFFANPWVSTIVGFAIFSVVFWAALEAIEWGAGRMTLQMPATQASKNIRELFRLYESRGWDMQKLCDDRNLLQGGLLDHLKPLMFWKDTIKCGDELVLAFLKQHQDANKAWRSSISDPFYESITSWLEFTFRATNMHKSAYMFYKDIAEQIKVQRNSGQKIAFIKTKNNRTHAYESLGYRNTNLYNHPLPLFRSEPYFGWDYKLRNDETTQIDYPTYDGQTVTWSERYANRTGVDDLTRRKNHFKNEVLPVAVRRLESRLRTLDTSTEYGQNQKKETESILKYLTFETDNGRGNLAFIAKGLYRIAMQVESQSNFFRCEKDGDCFWTEFQKNFLDQSLWKTNDTFTALILPSLIEVLQNYKIGLEATQIGISGGLNVSNQLISNIARKEIADVEEIIGLLNSKNRRQDIDPQSVNLGIEFIHKKIKEVPRNYNCDPNAVAKTVVIEPADKICPEDDQKTFPESLFTNAGYSVSKNLCFWKAIKNNLVDQGHLNMKDLGHTQFLNNQEYWAGYKTTENKPFGVKPIGPGQGYFLRYFDKFKNNGVDPYYYDPAYASMTDYLLKEMICGVDVVRGEQMLQKTWADKLVSWIPGGFFESAPDFINKQVSAEFKAPRIALNENSMNPCFGDETHNRWRAMGPSGTSAFYNYIEDVSDPKFSYGGIVEFLYKEADDSFVQDFDGWWNKYVAPQFSIVIDKLYHDSFNNDLLVKKLTEIVSTDNTNSNCEEFCLDFSFEHKNGVAAAVKQEMDTYFTYFFTPLLKGIPVDLENSELTDPKEARYKLQTDFANIRSEIYDIFYYTSGRQSKLKSPELAAQYADTFKDIQAELTVQNPELDPNYDLIKVKALRALLAQKDYELRILTRTDDMPYLNRIYGTSIALLNEMLHLTESEKAAVKFNIDENFKTLTAEFDSRENREGKVILKYQDWPADQPGSCEADQDKPSPTFAMASSLQQLMFESMDELLELQAQKGLAKITP